MRRALSAWRYYIEDIGDIDLQHLHRGEDSFCVSVDRLNSTGELF